jgi:hypothetical protein
MGRRAKSTDHFSPGDSNTICDTTGFKVKRSEVSRRWEGFYVISDAWHPRQSQDFPVAPKPQRVVKDVRLENLTTEDALPFEII